MSGHPIGPAATPPGRLSTRLPAAVVAVCLAPAVAIDLLWLFGVSGPRPLVLAQTLAVPIHALALAAIPAVAAMGVGLVRRTRRPCRVVTAAAATVAVLLVGAGLMLGDRGGGPSGEATNLTVYSANLAYYRAADSLDLSDVVAAQPDVAVFQEVTPAFLERLEATLLDYRLVEATPRNDAFGAAMFSRLPVESSRVENLTGSPTPVADVRTPDGVVTVVGVHTLPPFFGLDDWRAQHEQLAELANRSERVVLIGDFNAIGRLRPMRDLVAAAELSDAHRDVGTGLGLTWPDTGIGPLPAGIPIARLDRALSRGVTARSLRVGPAHGSDHRPIEASFSV